MVGYERRKRKRNQARLGEVESTAPERKHRRVPSHRDPLPTSRASTAASATSSVLSIGFHQCLRRGTGKHRIRQMHPESTGTTQEWGKWLVQEERPLVSKRVLFVYGERCGRCFLFAPGLFLDASVWCRRGHGITLIIAQDDSAGAITVNDPLGVAEDKIACPRGAFELI